MALTYYEIDMFMTRDILDFYPVEWLIDVEDYLNKCLLFHVFNQPSYHLE